jgi:predicted component of type VI protein secretion system
VTVSMKQRLEQSIVAFAERLLELSKPMLRDRENGFGSGEHRCAFASIKLQHLRRWKKGGTTAATAQNQSLSELEAKMYQLLAGL